MGREALQRGGVPPITRDYYVVPSIGARARTYYSMARAGAPEKGAVHLMLVKFN